MGLAITQTSFTAEDEARFAQRLERCLTALRQLLQTPGFGDGPTTIGSELELFLVDAGARPAPINLAVLRDVIDPRLTVELDRFNLEINGTPAPLAGAPFTHLMQDLRSALDGVGEAAARHGARVAVIGLLPTLRRTDLGPDAMTAAVRYQALSAQLRKHRRAPFRVSINGADPLLLSHDDVTLEGANTSFQVHLRVAPAEFARVHNAAQLATAPVLAVSGNAPLFVGHRLWEETRIALFKQAVDARTERSEGGFPPPRVSFGHGWVRSSAWELFAAAARLHPALLPVVAAEDPLDAMAQGRIPSLAELRLHCGTVWSWNRAVYDAADGGHLRVELRALPAGPTLLDMAANAAFLLGLTLGLAPEMDEVTATFPFRYAEWNFYRAAQRGLDAQLLWPDGPVRRVPVRALVHELLPRAREGLVRHAVDPSEADRLLEVVRARTEGGLTGARWQREVLAQLQDRMPLDAALAQLTERYLANAAGGAPVHRWSRTID